MCSGQYLAEVRAPHGAQCCPDPRAAHAIPCWLVNLAHPFHLLLFSCPMDRCCPTTTGLLTSGTRLAAVGALGPGKLPRQREGSQNPCKHLVSHWPLRSSVSEEGQCRAWRGVGILAGLEARLLDLIAFKHKWELVSKGGPAQLTATRH